MTRPLRAEPRDVAQQSTLFEEARRRYAYGDLSGAATLLERRDPLDDGAFFLHALIAIRRGAATRAASELTRRLPDLMSGKSLVRAHLLLAAAALAADRVAEAEAALAAVHDLQGVDVEREEEALYRAIVAHRHDRPRDYRMHLRIACASADGVINARAHRFAGDVAIGRGDPEAAFAAYDRGVSALSTGPPVDDRLLSSLLVRATLGEAERATGDCEVLVATVAARDWHPSVLPVIAVALHYAAISRSRRERYADAGTLLLRSAALSGETANAVSAMAWAAQNGLATREPHAARSYYAYALDLRERIDWRRVHAHARIALLTLAKVAARYDDVDVAQGCLDTYAELGDARAASKVTRWYGSLMFAHARALIAARVPLTRNDGIRELRRLGREWAAASFVWRVMETRADLYALTGQTYLLEANRQQRRSLVANPAENAVPHVRARLSPQQERIVAAVVRGSSTEEMAAEFGLSARTVKNQLQRIYARLDIPNPSREKLVAVVRGTTVLRSDDEPSD